MLPWSPCTKVCDKNPQFLCLFSFLTLHSFLPLAQLPKDWTHIINDSQCQTLFASTEEIYHTIKKEVLPSTPLLNEVICLDIPKEEPNSFEGLMDISRENCSVVEPTEDDLANLIYTSGTTGKPKVGDGMHCSYCDLQIKLINTCAFNVLSTRALNWSIVTRYPISKLVEIWLWIQRTLFILKIVHWHFFLGLIRMDR